MNNRTAGASYIQPGAPPPPPPAIQPNTYIPPSAIAQQLSAPPPPTPKAALTPGNGHDDQRHNALLNEWRRRHSSDWVRADDLSTTVRRMIDERERLPAVRQKLPRLVASCSEIETMTTGNAARQVVLYRLAGLEGP